MLKTSYPQKATAALLLWLLSFNVFASTLVYQNNGNETTYSETTIGSTSSTTTLNSGGDTTLDGAIVQGKHVKADVGGNLTINTPQDVSHYDSKQTSYGVGVSIPLGAGAFGVSGSYSNDKVNANTNTTQEIAGIYAGEGGYDIQVKGNTTLDAGVIASTATPDKNQFTTSTLVLKDKANQSAYDANSVGLSASYSGKQTTTDANGNTVPKMITNDKGEQVQAQGGTVKGFGANLPSTMSASDDASSTTRAAISAGNIRITNDAAQQQLTGQTAEQTIAGLNYDTTNNATLTNLYEQDKESIQTGFAIGRGLSQNFATFMNYMAQDMDSVAKSPAVGKDGKPIIGADGKPMTNQEAYQAGLELGDTVNETGESINYGTRQDLWGSGGTGNRIATALIGAYSGNVSNGASTLLQNTALNVVRTYGATEIKHLADSFSTQTDDKGNPIPNGTSETVRGLLHAVAGCAGASATGGDCASAGLASAGTVAMNNAMTALLNLNPNDMTDTQKQAYSNLIGTLVAGVSTAVGGDAAAAQLASKTEVDDNWLASHEKPRFRELKAGCDKNPSVGNQACRELRGMMQTNLARDEKLAESVNVLLRSKYLGSSAVSEEQAAAWQHVLWATPYLCPGGKCSNPDYQALYQLSQKAPSYFDIAIVPVYPEDYLLGAGGLMKAGLKGLTGVLEKQAVKAAETKAVQAEIKASRLANNALRDEVIIPNKTYELIKSAEKAGWKTPEGRTWYPPDNGAVMGTQQQVTLPVGTKLDRYGGTSDKSTFLAPADTPMGNRALPPDTNFSQYDQFVVVKPLPVEQSNVMPWFGQPGMGKQFDTAGGVGLPINKLIEQGYLRKVTP